MGFYFVNTACPDDITATDRQTRQTGSQMKFEHYNPMMRLRKKQVKKYFLTFLDLHDGFSSFPAGSREDFWRRIRIWGQKIRILASRGRNLRKTFSRIFVFNPFFLFLSFFLNPIIGLPEDDVDMPRSETVKSFVRRTKPRKNKPGNRKQCWPGHQDEKTLENIAKNSKHYKNIRKNKGKQGFILIILVTRMKSDLQDDSSFSSWYPIKTVKSALTVW